VPEADFLDDLIELGDAFETPQAIFEVFRNPQPRARPGGEFSKHAARMKFAVLLDHQFKMTREEAELFGCGRLEV